MLTYFSCPDNVRRPIKDCLEKCPRSEGRCLTLPTLYEIGTVRPFTKPSITQCLNPTRMEYLRLKCDYAVSPVEQAFMLLGTRVHKRLEVIANKIKELKAEQRVEDEDTIGHLDLLEPDELYPNSWKLTDTKTWGSYQVAKILKRKANGEYDLLKVTLQVNGYRIKVEPLGLPVSRLFVQAIIRDGGTYTAKDNGITEKMIMIPLERMPDEEVKAYFNRKAQSLLDALVANKLPEWCGYNDSWGSKRCKGFCDVVEWCNEGSKVAKVPYRGD